MEAETMKYQDVAEKMATYRNEISGIRAKMREAQAVIEPEPVTDYVFSTPRGSTPLSALFGDKSDLIVIHNMGASCAYCTLWADGFNGVYHHLASRTAFVISSPDRPDAQERFAAARGWRFPMVSHANTTFAADMGYRSSAGGWMPGITAFRKSGQQVLRVSDTGMGPGDDFCSLWHFFDLLPEGSAGWTPQYKYS
jgi:predicted dithiol-disulfide oxidoreductase (DUF899 family)